MANGRTHWRWDQGHQQLLDFQAVQSIARVLSKLDGVPLVGADQLRQPLMAETGLGFAAPETHSVWRQYKRAFQLALLADKVEDRLAVTDVCRVLASDPNAVADDFLLLFARRFCLPSPAFAGYETMLSPIYPAAAVLKLMLAKNVEVDTFSVDAQCALDYIAGNDMNGTEPVTGYADLARGNVASNPDELRQVREMLSFLSQISWLYWEQSTLKMAFTVDEGSADLYAELLMPDIEIANLDRPDAFFALASLADMSLPVAPSTTSEAEDIKFFEGRRKAVTHLRIERSRKLKLAVLNAFAGPAYCDICKLKPGDMYPWVDSFLQVHHLLPLASTLARTTEGTRLDDVRAICPNCHTAVHAFYGNYLQLLMRDDFVSIAEAKSVYEDARSKVELPK